MTLTTSCLRLLQFHAGVYEDMLRGAAIQHARNCGKHEVEEEDVEAVAYRITLLFAEKVIGDRPGVTR